MQERELLHCFWSTQGCTKQLWSQEHTSLPCASCSSQPLCNPPPPSLGCFPGDPPLLWSGPKLPLIAVQDRSCIPRKTNREKGACEQHGGGTRLTPHSTLCPALVPISCCPFYTVKYTLSFEHKDLMLLRSVCFIIGTSLFCCLAIDSVMTTVYYFAINKIIITFYSHLGLQFKS